MKQVLLPIVAAVAIILAIGVATKNMGKWAKPVQKEIALGQTKLSVQVVSSEAARKKGLAGVTKLEPNSGMLFVFGQKQVFPSFWMKDMLIPIDIIWISRDQISKITKDIPPPKRNTPEAELTFYYPDKPIDYVLEVNAGFSDKNGMAVGTPVDVSGLK